MQALCFAAVVPVSPMTKDPQMRVFLFVWLREVGGPCSNLVPISERRTAEAWEIFQVAKIVNTAPHYSTHSNIRPAAHKP